MIPPDEVEPDVKQIIDHVDRELSYEGSALARRPSWAPVRAS